MIFKQLIQYFKKHGNCEKGFTIIEVMIAMVIFSIGFLGLTKMQITGIKGNDIAGQYTEGSSLGVSQIESLMAMAYGNAALVNNATGSITQGIYTMNWTVTDDIPIPNVKQINIVVTWNDRSFTANYYKAVSF